ncbi:MAG: TolC family protein [bacterium]|nr:TolC family protein [bacterium]
MTKRYEILAIAPLVAVVLCGQAAGAQTYGLDDLRAAARAEHPTLESARAAVEAARAALRQERVFDDPVASLESGEADGGSESGTEWRAEVSQRIPLPGYRRQRVRSAEAGVERARYNQQALAALLDYEVGRLWAVALLAERKAAVGVESEGIARRLLELTERRVEAGEAAPLAAVKARTEWFARRQLSRGLAQDLAAARAALDVVCNRSLGREFALTGELDAPRALPMVETLLARLESSSPELQATQAATDEAEAMLAAQRKAALPDLELSVGRESELDKEATSAGVAFRLPLWNRNRAEVAAADARLQEAGADLDVRRLDLGLELEKAVIAYRAAEEQLALYNGGWRDSAARAVEIAQFSYENGESSLLDLLDAQRSLLEVGLTEVEARARLTLARLHIERLLGLSLDEVDSHENN